ncbi:MAG: AtpZ/AtpI family protein [Gemmatimonadaceae bacterium]
MKGERDRAKARETPAGKSDGGAVSGAAFASFGLQFAISLVVFLFLGQWLDRRLGTSPLFILLGVFVGGGATFYGIYRKLMAAQRREEERPG